MNESLCQNISQSIERMNDLRTIIERTPAFARWGTTGERINFWLTQLFPATMDMKTGEKIEYPIPERQRDAKAIARALGGTWTRRRDGSWESQHALGGFLHIILHRVDRDKEPEEQGSLVDLSDPPDDAPYDDTTHACPDCERPNQFGEVCLSCQRDRDHDLGDTLGGVRAEERP